MRSCLAVPVLLAGLLFSAQHLPAQFSLYSEGSQGSRIGVGLHDIDANRAATLKLGSVTGVEVVSVDSGSPAEQAGIRVGDVLLSYNGESIVGAQQLGRLVLETPVGRKVKIEYSRDGRVSTVTATTAARPANEPMSFNNLTLNGPNDGWMMSAPVPTPRFSWTNMQLGIECEGLDARNSQLAEFFGVKRGVLVRSVNKDSAAAKSRLTRWRRHHTNRWPPGRRSQRDYVLYAPGKDQAVPVGSSARSQNIRSKGNPSARRPGIALTTSETASASACKTSAVI